jgi:hypothetical protein
MGGASTILTSVKMGDLWRVQIAWPSGTTKYFVKFGSEQEAARWISRHCALTERTIDDTKFNRPGVQSAGERLWAASRLGRPRVASPRPKTRKSPMKDDSGHLDQIYEALMTYDLSDEALEGAARVDGRPAITIGYCATASNAWYCLPY